MRTAGGWIVHCIVYEPHFAKEGCHGYQGGLRAHNITALQLSCIDNLHIVHPASTTCNALCYLVLQLLRADGWATVAGQCLQGPLQRRGCG